MANILTAAEGAAVLRCDVSDANMLALLPQIDAYIKNGTGHDWATDSPILPEAKAAARMLLVKWHEDPGMISQTAGNTLNYGLTSTLLQLEVIALRYHFFYGRDGAGAVALAGVSVGDTVSTLVGLIGVSGDQKAAFESVITVDGEIQQISTSDLSEKMFKAYVIPPEGL